MKRSVCAILITYNRLPILKTALAHVLAQATPPTTVIIVDNNCSDGTTEYLQQIEDGNKIKCIYLKNNIGSAGGIALGMELAMSAGEYEYFWILDDDTNYDPMALPQLIESMETSDYAFIGLTGYNIRYGKKVKADENLKLQTVDYSLIDGALIRCPVVKEIGTVSQDFFMMCDDHEYCMRIKKFGYKVGLLDIGPIDRLLLGGEGKFTRATLWRGYYSSRNMMLILKKYFSFSDLFGYTVRQSKLLVAAAIYAPDRMKRVRFRLMGIWHGLIGVSGKTLDPATMKFTRTSR